MCAHYLVGAELRRPMSAFPAREESKGRRDSMAQSAAASASLRGLVHPPTHLPSTWFSLFPSSPHPNKPYLHPVLPQQLLQAQHPWYTCTDGNKMPCGIFTTVGASCINVLPELKPNRLRLFEGLCSYHGFLKPSKLERGVIVSLGKRPWMSFSNPTPATLCSAVLH